MTIYHPVTTGELITAVREAQEGDTIVANTVSGQELAGRALARQGTEGVTIQVSYPPETEGQDHSEEEGAG